MNVERTDFVNISTQDLARAVEFYGETLGLQRNPRASDEWPEFETGNLTLVIADVAKTGMAFAPSNNAVALRVANVDEAKHELEARGVTFEFEETYDSGVCHMAFFRDPDGNALILHRRHSPHSDGVAPVITVERSDFVALPSQDYERTRKFYGEILGLPESATSGERYVEFETGNIAIGFYTPRQEFKPSTGIVALRVPDVEQARAALEAAGVEFEADTIDSSVCHMAIFKDPDGNTLMLHRRYGPLPSG